MPCLRIIICVLLLSVFNTVQAGELSKGMAVRVLPNSGDPVTVATIDFEKKGDDWKYTLNMEKSLFSDHFLSMRPFKCFDGPRHMLCHLVYPYDKTSEISSGKLIDLEYDLLFIHRSATEYGINPWNGIYYKLSLDESGEKIHGELREVNLDILAAPPEEGVQYPIQEPDLIEVEADGHSFPRLVIEKAE